MTESQKRNARRKRAKCRAMGSNQLHLSFKCSFWKLPRPDGCIHWGDEDSKARREWGLLPTVSDVKISRSTLDIPDVTCVFRLGAEDPSVYLGELKGTLNCVLRTIQNMLPIYTGGDGHRAVCSDADFVQLLLKHDYAVRLEIRGQLGSMDPWRLKWLRVDVETVVADVIAAIYTQGLSPNLATS